MSVEASEEEGKDILLLVRSWTGGPGGEMCFEVWVKFRALFGSAPELVASIVKEIENCLGRKGLLLDVFIWFENRAFRGN